MWIWTWMCIGSNRQKAKWGEENKWNANFLFHDRWWRRRRRRVRKKLYQRPWQAWKRFEAFSFLLRSLEDEKNERNFKLTSKCSSDSDTSRFPSPRVVSRRHSKSINSRRGKSVRSSSTFFFLDFFKLQCLSIYFSLFLFYIETKLRGESSNFFIAFDCSKIY